jgi:hypothetical protein
VPDNHALGRPHIALWQIVWGIGSLGGWAIAVGAIAGTLFLIVRLVRENTSSASATALAMFAGASLPWLAFLEGHPYRIRYMVPFIAAEAIVAGVAVGFSRRLAPFAAAALLAAAMYERPPFDHQAAMVAEAQWDKPNGMARQPIGEYLRDTYDGQTIMASMGSLGHYMQELSNYELRLRDFLHEGNGDLWLRALETPRPLVGWILIDEHAEGGDMLAVIARQNPHFLTGFSRVREGGGVALYARQPELLAESR